MRPHGEAAAAFALGLVGLVRVLPIVLCSLAGGVVADAFDRKRLILAAQIVMLVSAAAGAPFSVLVGGAGCLLAVLFTALRSRELLRFRFKEEAGESSS